MESAARRNELLEQVRALPVEDREYIEAALRRDAHELRHRTDSAEKLDEIMQRAVDALASDHGFTREESTKRARGAVERVRERRK